MEIDTANHRLVTLDRGEFLVLLNPPARGERLTRAQALNLAAWLVAMADVLDDSEPRFADYLRAVRAT